MPKITGVWPRAISESATANGSEPLPETMQILKSSAVVSGMTSRVLLRAAAGCAGQHQRPLGVAPEEIEDLAARRIRCALTSQGRQPFRERTRSVKERVIERTHLVQPLAREFAPAHADDVQALERGVLSGGEAVG